MNYHFDVERLRNEIRALVAANPVLEDDAILRADMIQGETSIEEVMDLLLRVQRRSSTQQRAIEDEMELLGRRADRYKARVDGLRKLMFTLMQGAGIKSLERPLGTLSVAAGRPKVIVTNDRLLPDEFIRTKLEVNKQAIAAAMQEGKAVPGATWSNAEPHLTIRT